MNHTASFIRTLVATFGINSIKIFIHIFHANVIRVVDVFAYID